MSADKLDHGTIRISDAPAKAGTYPVILQGVGDGYIQEDGGIYMFKPASRKGGRKPMELRPGMEMHFLVDGQLPYKRLRLI
jgi:hypothetical protein